MGGHTLSYTGAMVVIFGDAKKAHGGIDCKDSTGTDAKADGSSVEADTACWRGDEEA